MDEAERQRLHILEQKVDFLISELGLEARFQEYQASSIPRDMNDVVALVRRGNKIAAIKLYREKTGVGLKEAKDVVDRM